MVRMDSSTAQGPGVRKPASLFIQTQKARARAGAGLLQTLQGWTCDFLPNIGFSQGPSLVCSSARGFTEMSQMMTTTGACRAKPLSNPNTAAVMG